MGISEEIQMLYIITAVISALMGFMCAAILPRKTAHEQRIEDEEQMKYLAEYRAKKMCKAQDKNEW